MLRYARNDIGGGGVSFRDQGLSVAQRFGCALYAIVAFLVSAFFAIAGAIGDCPQGNDCPSETGRSLMVYGVPLGFFVGGLLLTWYFMRDKN